MEWFRSEVMGRFQPHVRFRKKRGMEWFHIVFGWRNWERNGIATIVLKMLIIVINRLFWLKIFTIFFQNQITEVKSKIT
jgi:hypothetical protein